MMVQQLIKFLLAASVTEGYEYKGVNKVWKGKLSESKASCNSIKIQEAQECNMGYPMEMVGVVTYTGAKIIQNARLLVESIGIPGESKQIEKVVDMVIVMFVTISEVNPSGQFIGVAEMVGKLDLNKTMDFCQLDKWSGFFPVQWHIIKDVPHAQLRHIILDNCKNRPVTFTRDAQEVGLKQGIEMIKIFKCYSARSSLLDNVEFFDNQEKSLLAKKSCKLTSAHQAETQVPEQVEAEGRG